MKKLTPTIKNVVNQIKKTDFSDVSKNAKKAIDETKQTFEKAKDINIKAKLDNSEFKKEIKKTTKAIFDEKKVWQETFKALGGKTITGAKSYSNLTGNKIPRLTEKESNLSNIIPKKSQNPTLDYNTYVKQMNFANEMKNGFGKLGQQVKKQVDEEWQRIFKMLGGRNITGAVSNFNLKGNSFDLNKIRNLSNPQSSQQQWESFVSQYPKSNVPTVDYETAVKQMKIAKELQNQNIAKNVSLWELLKQKISQAGVLLQNAKGKIADISNKTKEASLQSNIFKGKLVGVNQVAGTINNKIKNVSSNFKVGIKNILKYATALFSIRSIYSLLSQSASSWLSSQDAGAQQASANINYMKNALGSTLAPVINYIINLVYQLMKAVQSVIYALTGMNIFAKASAKSFASTAGSAKKASEASKTLAGVHSEINNIGGSESSGSGSGNGTPSFDLSEIDNTPNSIVDAIKNGNWYDVGNLISQKINETLEKIDWNSVQQKVKTIATNIGNFINGFVDGLDWNLLGRTIGNGINTAFIFANTFLTTTNWGKIGSSIANFLNSEISAIDWNLIGTTFANSLNALIDLAHEFVVNFEWEKFGQSIGTSIASAIKNIDWKNFFQTLVDTATGLLDMLNGIFIDTDYSEAQDSFINGLLDVDTSKLFKALARLAGKITAEIVKCLTGIKLWEYLWKYLIEPAITKMIEGGDNTIGGFFKGIGDALAGVAQWIDENIFQPFIQGFKDAFGIHSPSTVMAEMGGYIIDGLKEGLTGIWEKVKDKFETLKNNLGTKLGEAKDKVVEFAGNTKNKITTWAGETKAKITDWGSNVKEKMKDTWDTASSKVKEKAGEIGTNISTKLGNAKTTITTWAENVRSSWTSHWNNMSNSVNLENAKNHIENFKNEATNKLSGLGQLASTWGKDLTSNLANGIQNGMSKVTTVTSNLASKIKSFLHFSEPDVGPLSDFHTYMPDMIDLMVNGIRSNASKLTTELQGLTTDMSYIINTPNIDTNSNLIRPNNLFTDSIDRTTNVNSSANIKVQIGAETLFDDFIEYVNEKSRRTGKNVIVEVGD